jgi:NarL family two-component system sensor histidine kinase LiaS
MSLELILLVLGGIFTNFWGNGTNNYLSDVITTLVPDARSYLQPEVDRQGLQVWLDTLYRKGYASLEPQDAFDSPAARIVPGSLITVLDQQGNILAQSPAVDFPSFDNYDPKVLQNAESGSKSISELYAMNSNGNYWMAVPIYQSNHNGPVLGVIVITLEPNPQRNTGEWAELIFLTLGAGFLMLLAIAPLGAIYGLIFSRSLTNRLTKLTTAAEAWGEGNFLVMPPIDRSTDEIGILSLKMRQMAEKINNLLQDQKALAQMKERNHLAQELHDTVKQENFATLMQIRAARNLLQTQPEAAERALRDAEMLLKNTQNELGLLISELRPPELEGKGLAEAIKEYTQNWSQQACIPVNFTMAENHALPFEVEKALFRIMQEALSNVLRHSRASAVNIELDGNPDQTQLTISDNGVGFESTSQKMNGFGLISMNLRAQEIGGQLQISSTPDNGTSVRVIVPAHLPQTRGEI